GQSPNLQIGVAGGTGTVKVGDGTGAAGSAVLNLRDLVNGADNVITVNMNLGSNSGGGVGTMVINADGLLEGDVRTPGGASNPVIRIGQAASATNALSSMTVDGGQFNAHGTVELGSDAASGGGRSNGMLTLTNGGRMDMDGGELNVGWNGDGAMVIEKNAVFSKTNNVGNRLDILVGREAAGIGTVTIQSGGQLLRGAGGEVADLRIGLSGTGTMIINDGGLVQNNSGNWDWIGQNNGSRGTLTINAGGSFITTGGTNFNVGTGTGATGVVTVNGGTLDLQSTNNSILRLGENGNGTFTQISGTTNVQAVNMSEASGTSTFDLQGGTFTSRSNFFMGGAGAGSAGTGVATATQTGGTLQVGGAFVVGLAPGHSGSYTLTAGEINHTASDISIGESGAGSMRIAVDGTLNDTSTAAGAFFVGRNAGSSGTLIVDGLINRSAGSPIRVGNGDTNGTDNTNATGILGGTGTITTVGGVQIGTLGTLTGGTLANVGTLSLTGDLNFSQGGTLFANFNTTGGSDRISLTGAVNLTDAILGGEWLSGGLTGSTNPYWLLVNDGDDEITGTFSNLSLTSPNAAAFPTADAWATIGGQEFAVYSHADFDTGANIGGNDFMLVAVPEPGVGASLFAGLTLLAGLRRRRR
ncbi:MAG: PEP-CTERM sorting domain-containing protein, partial [Verrucomicrobiota bacterium]